ncbi:SRPBCC family protein [Pelagibius marinus]|uniref:SRPBCC family protein n=1 Tax=Pelagibius marinus TaxID=2762760 RepID=UPI001872C6CB|nr:SRPBCC family protein [Pelagibius marinus]
MKVPKLVLKSDVALPPEQLWRIISDFAAPNRWNPLAQILACDGDRVGSIRRVQLAGAGVFVERLDRRDDGQRIYSYAIVESPLPISNASVEVRVTDNDDETATIEWTGTFDSEVLNEFLAVRSFQQVYQGVLDNLVWSVGKRKQDP